MPTTIELPQVGESVTQGTVLRWLKKPGDAVARYEPLVEVETDKVTMEVPSPVAGVLRTLLVEEGATVLFGAPICQVDTEEAPAGNAAPPIGTTGVLTEPGGFAVGPTGARPINAEQEGLMQAVPQAHAPVPSQPSAVHAPEPSPPSPQDRPRRGAQRLSPVVLNLAREHGLSPEQVAGIPGSGFDGRVTKQDVLTYIEGRGAPALADAKSAEPPVPTSSSPLRADPDEETVPLSPVRRRIAENMARSAAEIPAAWSLVEADVSGLVRRRQAAREEFRWREGVELTYLPFAVQALAEALKRHPRLNSRWGGDAVLLRKRINIGIAVAAPQGLVVPVVHDADGYSVAGLARAIAGVVERARQNRLSLEDVQGGTFTLNNTGALGSVVSQPIINHPQAAILTTEAIVKRPVVVDDAIAIRSMMNLCLTFDHRIIDGAESAVFLQLVKQMLEAVDDETAIY